MATSGKENKMKNQECISLLIGMTGAIKEIREDQEYINTIKHAIKILELEEVASDVQPRVREDEEEADVLLLKLNKRLAIYQKAINEIDDYFEYRYAQFDREEIRKYVYDVLDSLAKKLGATKTG